LENFGKLPLLAILAVFKFTCSPYYVESTSLNAHKPIILSIGKKTKKTMSILGI
jgi:hypothetical protein